MGSRRGYERRHVSWFGYHSRYNHGILLIDRWFIRDILQLTYSIAVGSTRYGFRLLEHVVVLVLLLVVCDYDDLTIRGVRTSNGRLDNLSSAVGLTTGC